VSAGGEPTRELVELPRQECLGLLGASHIGRVIVARGEDQPPLIRPVNFLFDTRSQSVVFRTSDGTKLHALLRSAHAAFEVDEVDPEDHTGWSVIILGHTEEITQASEIRRLEGTGLHTWAPGDRSHWIRIRARTVSGRRITGRGITGAP
jgi:nitroimidazol reductase NimA-like FMN-containing flavoprotein (pyridoxamine 5'-phosphate oxidase superfamily)